MKVTIIQILFDFIGMNDTLIKLMNVANRKSANQELCTTYVHMSLTCRIFLEQLDAEIETQREVLDNNINIEPLINLKDSIILGSDKYDSATMLQAEVINLIELLIQNLSKATEVEELPPETYTMFATQSKTLEIYLGKLRNDKKRIVR